MNPTLRAWATQMLVAFFDGKGLNTPNNQIPPIEPDVPQPAAIPVDAQPAPRRPRPSSSTLGAATNGRPGPRRD